MEDTIKLSRRERKKKDRKYEIIRVARNLFAKRGFNNVSVNDIAEAADISYATFFNYFPSKDELYTAIYDEEIDDLYEFEELSKAKGLRASERIVSVFLQWWDDVAPFKIISLRVTEKYVSDQENSLSRDKNLLKLFERIIQSGVDEGAFRDSVDITMEALTILGLFYAGQVCNAQKELLIKKIQTEMQLMQKEG